MIKNNFVCRLFCLVAVIAGLSVFQANAQFTIGVKVAGNGTNYKDLTKFSVGADAGLFLRIGDQFYFQPEACYSFKRSKINNPSSFVSEVQQNSELRQHFIDVPVLLGYNFINKENFKVHLFLGPRFGFRIGSNLKDIDPLLDEDGNLQWAGQVGFGFDIWRFTLDARYDLASDKLFKQSKDGQSNNKSWTQNTIIVSLGIKFIK